MMMDHDRDLLEGASRYLEARASGRPAGPELERAWGAFHARCDAAIRATLAARGLRGAEQDDCAQEIWLDLIGRDLGAFRPGGVGAWLAAVARNKAADVFRARSRRPATSLGADLAVADAGAGDPACPEPDDPAGSARRAVWAALAELERRVSPVSFLAFYLRRIEGLSNAEIAGLLDLEPGPLRLRQHRVGLALGAILRPAAG